MTIKEFQEMIGGRHAAVMVCQVDGITYRGYPCKAGDTQINVDLKTAFALYKKKVNTPDGEVRCWLPVDASITKTEQDLMNKHFEKEHEMETGDEPVKIKSQKK